jgi:hypothetical protein
MPKNILDNLPFWDKKLGKYLEQVGPLLDILMLVVIGVTVWAILGWKNEYKALWLAFLVSP